MMVSYAFNSHLFTVCGMYWGHRRLMLPWLFLQGFLASILAALVRFIYTFSVSISSILKWWFNRISKSFQDLFRIISESIQNYFRIVSELFDKAITKQKDPKVCWDADKMIYIFEFCTVLMFCQF